MNAMVEKLLTGFWILLGTAAVILAIILIAQFWGCEAQAGLQNKIPVNVEGNKAESTEQSPVDQTGGQGWTINVNLRDGLLSIGAICLAFVLLVLILLRYRTALIEILKSVSNMPPDVARAVSTESKKRIPKKLHAFVGRLANKFNSYVKPGALDDGTTRTPDP